MKRHIAAGRSLGRHIAAGDFMANNRPMTEDEKKLLQAQHRMEAIEARNRQKERKARTRRLIQMGAVLESVFPEVQTMELDDVKMELKRRLIFLFSL